MNSLLLSLSLLLTVWVAVPEPTVPYVQTPAPAAAPTSDTAATARSPFPDLSGAWIGHLYQNEGGIAPKFDFNVTIAQNGIFVRGTSYVKYGELWAEMEFSGHRNKNGTLVLTETKILRSQKPNDLSWCMKKYELQATFTEDGIVLSGPWWGDSIYGPCIPGSVRLLRKTKTA